MSALDVRFVASLVAAYVIGHVLAHGLVAVFRFVVRESRWRMRRRRMDALDADTLEVETLRHARRSPREVCDYCSKPQNLPVDSVWVSDTLVGYVCRDCAPGVVSRALPHDPAEEPS